MSKNFKEKLDRVNYIGMILIIVGYVSFSNHDRIGDVIILTGALTILVGKWVRWKEKRAYSNMDQSKTYSS